MKKIICPNGSWLMSEAPVPQDPGREDDLPGAEWPEWMDEPGYLAAQCEDDPGDGEPEEYEDPDNAPPPGWMMRSWLR